MVVVGLILRRLFLLAAAAQPRARNGAGANSGRLRLVCDGSRSGRTTRPSIRSRWHSREARAAAGLVREPRPSSQDRASGKQRCVLSRAMPDDRSGFENGVETSREPGRFRCKVWPRLEPSLSDWEKKLEMEKRVSEDLQTLKADRAGTIMSSPAPSRHVQVLGQGGSGAILQNRRPDQDADHRPGDHARISRDQGRSRPLARIGKLPADQIYLPASILFTHRSDHIYTGQGHAAFPIGTKRISRSD